MNVFIVSIPHESEREICKFEMEFEEFFCLRSNISNDNMISA